MLCPWCVVVFPCVFNLELELEHKLSDASCFFLFPPLFTPFEVCVYRRHA
jgi:hypothetical protein